MRYRLNYIGKVTCFLLLVIGCALIQGCGKSVEEDIPTLTVSNEDTLATWSKGQISMEEAAKWALLLGDEDTLLLDSRNETEWVQTTIRNMIIEKKMAEEAREVGLDQTDSMKAKQKELLDTAVTRLFYRKNLVDKIDIPERQLKAYFEEHRKDYEIPRSFSFYMMFFDADKEGREKARRRALRVLEQIEAGAEFKSLIGENSDVTELNRTKEFGPYHPGEGLLPEIEEAALNLKVGQVSDLIEHKRGFHLIYLSQLDDAIEPKFEDYRDRVYEELFAEKLYQAEKNFIIEAKKNLKIKESFEIINLPITAENDIILRIEDETMTYGDYIRMLREGGVQTQEDMQMLFMRHYNDMIYRVLGYKAGLDQDPEVKEWVEIQMKRELTLAYLDQVIDSEVKISEKEIYDAYHGSQSLYYEPKMVFARHIYIPIITREDMSRHELIQEISNSRAQAMQIIEEIKQGLSFEEAAKLYSSTPDASQGGVLGWVAFGSSPRFDKPVFALEAGEITTEPVRGKRGFQIVKVEKKAPPHLMPYEVAWSQIHDRLHAIAADQLRSVHINELTENANIQLDSEKAAEFSDFIKAFRIRPNIYSISD